MKKILKLVIVGALLALALVGCGEEKSPAPKPDTTPKQEGQVTDKAAPVLEGVFNKTYVIGKEGTRIYGDFFIGSPTLSHKMDGTKAYIEVMVPLKLTNKAKNNVTVQDLLNSLMIQDNYNPYVDQLKIECIQTKAIVKGNTDKDNKEYFIGMFNKDLKTVNGQKVLEPNQTVDSYFKYVITTDDIEMDKLQTQFKALTLNDFEFIINAKDGDGYTIIK